MTDSNEVKTDKVIYWAPALKYELANFIPELWEHGRIVRRERSLPFHNNMCVLDPDCGCKCTKKEICTCDKKAIAHIENSKAFKTGDIIKCADMAEAHKLTRMRAARKSNTQINIDTDLSTQPAVASVGSGDL